MSAFLLRRLEAIQAVLVGTPLARTVAGVRLESAPNRVRGASFGGIVAASKVKKAHRLVGFGAGRAFAGRLTSARFHVVRLVRVGERELDDDNLDAAFKALRDGVAKGLGVDDRDPSIRYVVDQERGAFGVRLELYAATADNTTRSTGRTA